MTINYCNRIMFYFDRYIFTSKTYKILNFFSEIHWNGTGVLSIRLLSDLTRLPSMIETSLSICRRLIDNLLPLMTETSLSVCRCLLDVSLASMIETSLSVCRCMLGISLSSMIETSVSICRFSGDPLPEFIDRLELESSTSSERLQNITIINGNEQINNELLGKELRSNAAIVFWACNHLQIKNILT